MTCVGFVRATTTFVVGALLLVQLSNLQPSQSCLHPTFRTTIKQPPPSNTPCDESKDPWDFGGACGAWLVRGMCMAGPDILGMIVHFLVLESLPPSRDGCVASTLGFVSAETIM